MAKYYSPLRYPGGKGKLGDYFLRLLRTNDLLGCHYVEPYAGGAALSLSLLLNGHVEHIHLNDLNYPLYCFWYSVLNKTEDLCNKITNCTISTSAWKKHRARLASHTEYSNLDVGFSLLFLNRTNRSGIINGGMIGGLEQNGEWTMGARFYKKTLISRIEEISRFKSSITLYNMDAINFMESVSTVLPSKTLFYIDPPYYNKGQRLYDNYYEPSDHESISKVIKNLNRSWVVSYDNIAEISNLYRGYRKKRYSLSYSAANFYEGKELMVYSDQIQLPRKNNVF